MKSEILHTLALVAVLTCVVSVIVVAWLRLVGGVENAVHERPDPSPWPSAGLLKGNPPIPARFQMAIIAIASITAAVYLLSRE